MKVRGDGRSYSINLHSHGMYDITWHDLWQFPLYTRGGPCWQTVKVTKLTYLDPNNKNISHLNLTYLNLT